MSKEKTSKEHIFCSEDIIARLQEVTKSKTLSVLAEHLGTQQAIISNWKRKNTIPYNLIFEKFDLATAVYVLTGEKVYPKEIKNQEPQSLALGPEIDTLRRQVARLEGQLDQCRETNIQLLNTITELSKPVGTPSREKVSSH